MTTSSRTSFFASVAALLALLLSAGTVCAGVPVRISIKFILDANGNRPATGHLNTDAEILAEVDQGIAILKENYTELGIDLLELIDIAGASGFYAYTATDANRDAIRAAAVANPAFYHWRSDAINIYVNGGNDSAISQFPPGNDMILMCQWCGNNPSCILHEMGHSLNLMHTHQSGGADGCADTLADNQSWTKDQLAQANYGCAFASCTAGQQDMVNLTFNNIMSYHVSEPQRRISPCQMDRISGTADSDRSWMLSQVPVYVNSGYAGVLQFGTFLMPYRTLQAAVDLGASGVVIVLQQGTYSLSTTASTPTTMITRSGPSTVGQGAFLYSLPIDFDDSKTPEVRDATTASKAEDTSERKASAGAREAARRATTASEREARTAEAEALGKPHRDLALSHLQRAEKWAEGNEKLAIQLELGQRYRDAGDCAAAIKYFAAVGDATDQLPLRERMVVEINNCNRRLDAAAPPLKSAP